MFGRNKSRIFATQETHKLNSCNHNKHKNPTIREDRRVFYVGKRCRSVSASGVFACLS